MRCVLAGLLLSTGCVVITDAEHDGRLGADAGPVDDGGIGGTDSGGVPDDCDPDTDGVQPPETWYADGDADGYGAGDGVIACEAPAGHVAQDGDCDDNSADFHPGADESDCTDPNDYNCDGSSGSEDADGDGFAACEDCDDSTAQAHPDATEVCDDLDNDCDGLADEADDSLDTSTASLWYTDNDGDGYGVAGTGDWYCEDPVDAARSYTDCDDTADDVHPGAEEVCGDDIDNDCDGVETTCEAGLSGEISVDEATGTTADTDKDDLSGWSVAGPGDVDGEDGDDLLVGAPGDDLARIYSGGGGGAVTTAVAELHGANGSRFGSAVAGVGDIDGDGHLDLVVGADEDDPDADKGGAAYVFFGPLSGAFTASADGQAWTGDAQDGYAGRSIAGVGDVTGDGTPDFLVGAPEHDMEEDEAGVAFLVTTADAGAGRLDDDAIALTTDEKQALLGTSVAAAGDVNGDGVPDVLVGAPGADGQKDESGAAYLWLGPITRDISVDSADGVYQGQKQDDLAGWSVAGAGDVDGDGLDDVLVGAPAVEVSGDPRGRVYLILGPATGEQKINTTPYSYKGADVDGETGAAVAGVGDLDGDGFDDIAVGAPFDDGDRSKAGAVYVFYGAPTDDLSLDDATGALLGPEEDGAFGWSVAGLGDFTGTGKPSLAVGAPYDGLAGDEAGAVYVYDNGE